MGENRNKPSVSIIIPTFNRCSELTRSIRSILAQTFTDFELIVVDDCSTDDTRISVLAFTDPRIRYIRHKTNKGAAVARNTGIKSATGKWIAFQDSDDIWVHDKLERQMELFYNNINNNFIVYSGFIRYTNNSVCYIPEKHVKQRSGAVLQQLLYGNFVSTQTMVIPRACLDNVGLFEPKLQRFQDWELVIRLAEFFEFKIIDQPLVITFDNKARISADDYIIPESLSIILEKHKGLFDMNYRAKSIMLTNIGHFLCAKGEMKNGRRHLWYAIKSNYSSFPAWRAILVSLFGGRIYQAIVRARNK